MAEDPKKGIEEAAAANKKLEESAEVVRKSFDEQLQTMLKMRDLVSKMAEDMGKLSSSSTAAFNSDEIKRAAVALDATDKAGIAVTRSMAKVNKSGGELTKSMTTSQGAVSGLYQGMKNLSGGLTSVLGILGSLVGGLFKVGKAIIGIPFGMFKALVHDATSGGGGNELAAAYEAVRKQFGAFTSVSSSAIIDVSKHMGGLTMEGRDSWRIFGSLAERMVEMTKLATAMGPQFAMNADEFRKNGGAIMAYQKGLGLSEEMMTSIAVQSGKMGTSISDSLNQITKQSAGLAKAFGLDQKIIAREMGKASMDVAHFGHLSQQELGAAVAFTQKLGIGMEKLAGMMDKFSTFDGTAESVSVLNEQFGTNIDAMKLMSAQNPADKLEILRKAMQGAGKDIAKLSFHERKLLADQSGMELGALDSALAQKNAGVSMEKARTESEKAATATLTQTEAIKSLTSAMERMTKSGGGGATTFLGRFKEGMIAGIKTSPEYLKVMGNIRMAMNEAEWGGRGLGSMFVKVFPGVKKMFEGWADLFDPARFRKMFDKLHALFGKFFGKGGDILTNFTEFMDGKGGLKEIFFEFFDAGKGPGKKIIEGLKEFALTIFKIFAEAVKWAIPKIAETMKKITDFILHPEMPSIDASGAETFMKPLKEIFELMKTQLWPAAKGLFSTLFKKIWEFLKSDEVMGILKPFASVMAGVLFGPSLGRSLLGAASGGLMRGVGEGLAKVIPAIIEKLKGPAAAIAAAPTQGLDVAGKIGESAKDAIGKSGSWGPREAAALGLKLLAIAGAIALAGPMLAISLAEMYKILKAGGIKSVGDILPAVAILIGTAVAGGVLVLAMKSASNAGNIKDVLMGGLIVGTAVLLVGGISWLLTKMLSGSSPEFLKAAGSFMLQMSLVFLAMIPLISASIAIGALATGPQAAVLGLAAIGMGVVGVAVAQMVGIAMGIVEQLNKMQISAGFQTKIDAFLGIMKAIQAFTDSMVQVIGMMLPTFTEFITGSTSTFAAKVEGSRKLIKEMIEGESGKGGMIGLVQVVVTQLGRLDGMGPKIAETANVFASVMTAVAAMLKSITPSDAFYEATSGFMSRLAEGDQLTTNLLTATSQYTKYMMFYMEQSLNGTDGKSGILGVLKTVAAIKIPDPKSATAAAEMLASIANIMKSLAPDPKVIESMRSGQKNTVGWIDVTKEVTAGVSAAQIGDVMHTQATNLKDIIDAMTKGPLAAVIASAATLGPDKLGAIKGVADIMSAITGMINALAPVAKEKITPLGTDATGKIVSAVEKSGDIAEIMQKVGDALKGSNGKPGLMAALIDATKLIPSDPGFLKKVEGASKIFTIITEITKMSSMMSGMSGAPAGATAGNISDGIWMGIGALAAMLNRIMFLPTPTEAPLPVLLEKINALGGMLSKYNPGGMTNIAKGVTELGSVMTGINNSISTIATANVTDATVLETKMKSSITAIKKLTELSNELNDALSSGNTMKISTGLSKIAGTILGGAGNYTIQNKDVVINLDLKVTMDAGLIEQTMITRKQSVIRDRLNYALENTGLNQSSRVNAAAPNTGTFATGQP